MSRNKKNNSNKGDISTEESGGSDSKLHEQSQTKEGIPIQKIAFAIGLVVNITILLTFPELDE